MPRMQDVDPEKWARIQEKYAKKKVAKPLRKGVDKKPEGMRPEHDYSHGDMTRWELSVFTEADHFTVYRPEGRGARNNYKNYDDAYYAAKSVERALLYAVTESGRSTVIDRGDWDRCLALWRLR
jgi:hypothetical protein